MRSATSWTVLAFVVAGVTLLGAAPDQKSAPSEIPEAEKNRKNPVETTPESIERGQTLFWSQCAMCHGEKGDGKGELAERYDFVVVDFTDAALQKKRTDGELFYLLTVGKDHMPGEGERMPDAWKWDLVNYIRTLDDAK
ncbi:MAG: cytochrome c [Acidobacteriota bacterium]|nr:cytochrome c [Acidobacteriota bacterium]